MEGQTGEELLEQAREKLENSFFILITNQMVCTKLYLVMQN